MLVIRLTRKGKKNQPFFRVIVTDRRNPPKGGKPVEVLGYVDPLSKKKSLKKEKILYWLSMGAKPSITVHNLLVQEKIIEGKKVNVTKKSKKAPELTPEKTAEVPATPVEPEKPAEPAPELAPAPEEKLIEASKELSSPAEQPPGILRK
ncbi:MAG: small subunit ribosomal protein S16 [Parcubacteria group bacterium Licking1014_1]|nr:MAG: small subunit ribosomal protein S16 [Parcubacteria group bacterium Licking1014_1]